MLNSDAAEAAILNNMAAAHYTPREPTQTFELLKQALSILREAGNGAGEIRALADLGILADNIGLSPTSR